MKKIYNNWQGEVHVQESQIELNKVFLDEMPLKKLAEATGGTFLSLG